MGKPQTEFIASFKEAMATNTKSLSWTGGQITGNRGLLKGAKEVRRPGTSKRGEHFELGDLRTEFGDFNLVIEYDAGGVSVSNLIKFWSYLRDELNAHPERPMVLCHFSNWGSYGSYRGLWLWVLSRIQADSDLVFPLQARQFDHDPKDEKRTQESIREAVNWIVTVCSSPPENLTAK